MFVSRVRLQNWMNFIAVDVRLGKRTFVVGPNASGKSNFLDAIRFLRDLARGDGFGGAVAKRGGVSRIRCLAARRVPVVKLSVDLSDSDDSDPEWSYTVAFAKEPAGAHSAMITEEIVEHRGREVLHRPDDADRDDPLRLSQTHLEQISANKDFREVAEFLRETRQSKRKPQVITTTHSPDLLDDPGIAANEILLLIPGVQGTSVRPAAEIPEVRALLESGMSPAEVVIPATAPRDAHQLALFRPD